MEQIVNVLRKKELDSMIVTNGSNRRYLTGFTGSNGILIITEKRSVLITDYRYEEQAKNQTDQIEIILHKDHTGHKGSKSTIYQIVIEQLLKLQVTKIGFEQDSMIVGLYHLLNDVDAYELIPTLDLIEDLRMIKTPDEISKLKVAAEIADRTFDYVIDFIRPGITEERVSEEIGNFIKKQGASNTGFPPIVASGARSALAHGRASEKVIERGDIIVLDFGANYESYWSDITRTISVGAPDNELKEIYIIVAEALEQSLAILKPGLTDQQIDHEIKKHIQSNGYGEYAGTGTGHGLGMEVHENPYLSTKTDKIVKKNMVLAIEPGIYLPGKGGVRIEDNVLITRDGHRNWITATKELLIL